MPPEKASKFALKYSVDAVGLMPDEVPNALSSYCVPTGWMKSVEAHRNPNPFLWTANPDKIIAAVNRGRQVLDSIH